MELCFWFTLFDILFGAFPAPEICTFIRVPLPNAGRWLSLSLHFLCDDFKDFLFAPLHKPAQIGQT